MPGGSYHVGPVAEAAAESIADGAGPPNTY